jgi:hypothetical protein
MRTSAAMTALVWFELFACSSNGDGAKDATASGGSSGARATATAGGGVSTGGVLQVNTGGALNTSFAPTTAGGAKATNATSVNTGGAIATVAGGATAVLAGGAKTTSLGSAAAGTATVTGGGSSTEPSAQDLLNKVTACSSTATVAKSGFGLDGGSGAISMYQCQGAVYWKADMDVDCDGIQTPPCDTDPQGQPQTSIVDDAPNGDVDPTLLPYIVIPLGSPETTWYKSVGIELGQVGAVIYKGAVQYGIFADEAGGAFIGEASYAMCQLFLGQPTGSKDPCDPSQGGIDAADVTYVTFTGASNRATGAEIYSHTKHTSVGIAAAKAWLSK